MEIPGLNMLSDDEFTKMLTRLSGEDRRKQKEKNRTTSTPKMVEDSVPEIGRRPIPLIGRKNGQAQIRTARALKDAAVERGLEVGCTCRIERRAIAKDGSWILREVEKGTIVGVYASYFIVQIGNHRECFRWNEFWGDEHCKVKVRLKK